MAKRDQTDNACSLDLPFKIAHLHSALSAQAKAIITRHCDLNLAQWQIIRVVALGIADTSTAVRKSAGLDKSQFSKMLGVLEAKGYVTLRPWIEDKRQTVIALTEAAHQCHDQLAPMLDARQKHLVATLTTKERAALDRAIQVMLVASGDTDF